MREDTEVLVIGGGAIGVCSAYYLAQQGLRVSLFDQDEIASGCSGANAGLIVPSYCIPLATPESLSLGIKSLLRPRSSFYMKPRLDPALFYWLRQFRKACKRERMLHGLQLLRDLNYASLELFDQLIKGESLTCHYRQHGWLMVYKTEQGFRKAQENVALLKSHDVQLKVLDAGETLKMEAALHPEISGSVFFPEDAHLDPTEFVLSLADRLRKRGVVIRKKTKVLGFEISSDSITTVRTNQGDFQPRQVVLASGAWSQNLMKTLNLKLPVQPGKGYSISVKRSDTCPGIPLYFSEAKVAVTLLESIMRFAGTLELAGMDFSINHRRVVGIMNAAENYLRRTEKFDIIKIRIGLRPCSPDGLPIIDRSTEFKNLVVATGHGMLGITQAPITGKLVSQLVCEQAPDINLTPFCMARFG